MTGLCDKSEDKAGKEQYVMDSKNIFPLYAWLEKKGMLSNMFRVRNTDSSFRVLPLQQMV